MTELVMQYAHNGHKSSYWSERKWAQQAELIALTQAEPPTPAKMENELEFVHSYTTAPKQWAIMKTPRHSESDTVEAKANQFADTIVKEATLNTGSAQPGSVHCSLLTLQRK